MYRSHNKIVQFLLLSKDLAKYQASVCYVASRLEHWVHVQY